MSTIGTLYIKPPIYTVDGTVKEKTILDIASQIESGFEATGDVFGNLYGLGLDTIPYSRFVNSIAAGLGSMASVSPEEPFGVEFSDYVQNFTNNGRDKDFVLDLNPEATSVNIAAPDNAGVVWTRVSDRDALKSDGDYHITGRIITFYMVPSSAFSVSYNGTYPEFSSIGNGYMPNVYPSPSLISSGAISRPVLSARPSGRILIDTGTPSNKNSEGKIFGANLPLKFSPLIEQYVSEIGVTKCPSEYIAAWIKSGDTYRKLDTAGVYILSNQLFEIDTDEQIDLNQDTVVMAMSNISIADMIRDLYLSHSTHSHDNDSIVPSVSHSSLLNLIPQSNKSGVTYGGSSIAGNDHPQYMHREGYKIDDEGTYGNALLGDLLISSINPASLFNNTLEDSNRLVFGSTTEGVSLKYRADRKDLQLYSSENGLSVTYDGTPGKYGVSINGHKISDVNSNMSISSESGVTRFENNDASDLQGIVAGDVDFKSVSIDSLTFKDDGALTVGGVTFTDTVGDGNVLVSGDEISFDSTVKMTGFSGTYNVGSDSSIRFGDGSTFMGETQDGLGLSLFSANPMSFANTGKNTGLSIDWADKEYFNLYSATPNGASSTPADHDLYMEAAEGDTYLIKSTRTDQIKGGKVFTWQNTEEGKTRVDDLRNWPRAPLHAGNGSFEYIEIETSSIAERRGISFGELNHIYVTGSGTQCPPGWMVIESQNGVVLVDSRSDAIDCQTMRYSDLTAGDVQAFGSMIAEEDISAGRNLRAADTVFATELSLLADADISGGLKVEAATVLSGQTTVRAHAQFDADVEIKSGLTVQNTLNAGSITATGIAKFEETARFANDVSVDMNLVVDRELRVVEKATIEGRLTASEVVSGPLLATSVTASELLNANGGLYAQGTLSVNGNANISNALTVESSLVVNDTLSANRINTTGDIYAASSVTIEGDSTIRGSLSVGSENGRLLVVGDTALNGETTSITGKLECFGDTSIGGDLTVSSSSVFKSSMSIEGSITAESDLNCNGTIEAEKIDISGSAVIKAMNVENLLQAGSIIVSDSIVAQGEANISGKAIVQGGLEVSFGTSSSVHNLVATGRFSQTNSEEVVGIAGDVLMSKDATISGNLRLGTSDSNNTVLSGNSVVANGATALVHSHSVETNRIKGYTNDVSIPADMLRHHSSVANYLNSNKFVSVSNAYFDDYAVFSGDVFFTGTLYVNQIKRMDNNAGGVEYVNVISRETYYA